MIDQERPSRRRPALWIATLPFGFFAVLVLVARVVEGFSESRPKGYETLWVIVIGVLALPFLFIFALLPVTLPNVWRTRVLRRRFPETIVFSARRADGFDDALRAIGLVDTANALNSVKTSSGRERQTGEFFGVVVSEAAVSIWRGVRDPQQWSAIPSSCIVGVSVKRRKYSYGTRAALVLELARSGLEVQAPIILLSSRTGGIFSLSRDVTEKVAATVRTAVG